MTSKWPSANITGAIVSHSNNKADAVNLVTGWFRRTFSDPQVIALTLALIVGFAVIMFMGNMLAPVLASAVIAYLLEGVVVWLQRFRLPRLVSVLVVFVTFILFVTAIMFGLLFATGLTLGVVPILYSLFFRVSFKEMQ